MGGSLGCRCFLGLQRNGNLQPGDSPFFSWKHPVERRHRRSGYPVQTFPGKRCRNRRPVEKERDRTCRLICIRLWSNASVICFRHCRVYFWQCRIYIRQRRVYTRQRRKQITPASGHSYPVYNFITLADTKKLRTYSIYPKYMYLCLLLYN